MKRRLDAIRYAAAAVLALGLAGCVTTEDDVALGAPYASLTFQGFASAPGATVELYAFDKSAGDWEPTPVATATAAPNPINVGERMIYPWLINTALLDRNDPDTLCRLSSNCALVESSIRVQFREVDGAFSPLLTFDAGGVDCTIARVNEGADLYAAAWECKGMNFDELSIPVIL